LFNSIAQNYEALKKLGIFGTPTIIINNRMISHNDNIAEIENVINEEIKNSGSPN